MTTPPPTTRRPVLWVLTTTFPRWRGDIQPPFVLELSRRLTGRFDVYVLAPRAPDAAEFEQFDGLSIVRYPYFFRALESLAYEGGLLGNLRRRPWRVALVPFLLLGQWLALRRLWRREPADVVHAHWIFPQGWVAAFAVGARAPIVVTSHGADLYALRGRLWDWVRRFVTGRAAALTVVSSEMAAAMDAGGVPRARIQVAPMGVDLAGAFTPDPDRPRGAGHLVFVGRLVRKKGCDLLLHAMASLAEMGHRPSLTVIGDGPERVALGDLCRNLGLDGQVRFIGQVANENLPDWYRKATALVAPFVVAPDGDREGLGLVVVEAMGCECPVVSTPIATINDCVRDRATAWIAEPDAEAMASAIADLLTHPAEAVQRAKAARAAVLEKFDWPGVAARYGDLLCATVRMKA